MNATFIRIQLASGLYAKGQQVAVFLGDKGEFELSKQDAALRQQNRIKYGQDTTEETRALTELGSIVTP